MKIIGHRGARKVETENSLSAIQLAARTGVDEVEIDIRKSKDNHLFVCHDENLNSVYKIDRNIGDMNSDEIAQIKSPSGEKIITLKQALESGIDKPLVLDIKKSVTAEMIKREVDSSKTTNAWSASSLDADLLKNLKELFPNLETTLQAYSSAFKNIRRAKEIGANNITLTLYLLNPVTYRYAKKCGLSVRVYQNYVNFFLNSVLFVKLLKLMYPDITIYTDRPDKIAKLAK